MKTHFITIIYFFVLTTASLGQSMVITGVIDGPLTGGTPKAIEFFVTANITDLSQYGFGSANNGGGSDGEEFTFPAVAATAGDFIYVASETTEFTNFFGFAPDYTSGDAAINGDDAIELFFNGNVVDVFGEISAAPGVWAYTDGWAYRNSITGPDGTTFNASNWLFSGINALDGESTNAGATTPFPTATYSLTDDTPPSWITGFPLINNLSSTSFDIIGQLNEPGDIYYVVILHNEAAPSSAQVVAGTAPGAVQTSGNFNVPTASTDAVSSVSGLTAGTDYDLYVVAQDDETTPNLQASPIKFDFPESIAITEFLNNSLGSETTNEWIELYNFGNVDIDLTGWTISDEDGDNIAISAGTIASQDFVILSKSKSSFETQWLAGVPDTRVIELSITLADIGDEIILSDTYGNIKWSLAYADDETEGRATFLDYADDGSTTIFGSKASPGVVRNGNDVSGSIGYESNNSTTDSDAFTSTLSDVGSPLAGSYSAALPVVLVSFWGLELSNGVALNWITKSETDNDGFEIEKSSDGFSYEKIGFVDGHGTTNKEAHYSFIDNVAIANSYYRLRQLDFNGNFEYSHSIFVGTKAGKTEVGISPNPYASHQNLHISMPMLESGNINWGLVDITGKVLTIESVKSEKMEEVIEEYLNQINIGIYHLTLDNGQDKYTIRVVKR